MEGYGDVLQRGIVESIEVTGDWGVGEWEGAEEAQQCQMNCRGSRGAEEPVKSCRNT